MYRLVVVITMVSAAFPALAHDPIRLDALEKRVAALEEQLADLAKSASPPVAKVSAEQRVEVQRQKARERMLRDSGIYSRDELREIEDLYQVANRKWNSEEGEGSLKKLIGKYSHANRTGCALLYLGQMTQGEEGEHYLKRAIEDFSDSFYGDGVQVGAYARYYLAHRYREAGRQDEAEALFAEIRTDYPNAIDHRGRVLAGLIDP
jgi:tetratricopeptide (TPR) repeat protein